MDNIITWMTVAGLIVGWAVMAAAGLGGVLVAWWWIMQALWRMHTRTLNGQDILEAVEEWKRRNPEKAKRAASRCSDLQGDE